MICCFPVSLIASCLIGMWILLWPVTGSVWGVFAVTRQSIILMLYILLSSHCRSCCRHWLGQVGSFVSRLLDLLILIGLLMQPVSLLPDIGIQVYSYIISVAAEPLFIWIETALLVRVIVSIGSRFSQLVFAESSECVSALIKSLIILLTSAIYYFSMRILMTAMSVAPSPVFTYIAVVLLVTHILLGVGTYLSEEGIITNSALLFMASCLVFYSASSSGIERFDGYSSYSADESLLRQLLRLPEATTALTNQCLSWVRKNYGWTFWLMLSIRMMACFSWLSQREQEEDDEEYEDRRVRRDSGSGEEDHWYRKIASSFIWRQEREENEEDEGSASGWLRVDAVTRLKLMAVVVYSQQIIQRTGFLQPPSSSSPSSSGSSVAWIFQSFMPMEMFALSRLCQSLFIGLYYAKALHGAISLERQANFEYY